MTPNFTQLALPEALIGWQSPQSGRGTWDIIWSSLQTLTLCAWVSVRVSSASPTGGNWDILRDKLYFVLLTLLGPEFVLVLAFGQWQTARASLKDYQDAGYQSWTITHSFYADMGGVHVKSSDFPSCPANSKQLLYLLKRGYIDIPDVTETELEELGKSDILTNQVTSIASLAIASTFLNNIAARLAQDLGVTTLEVTVLANIFCTLGTYLCWWNKPSDIEVSHCYRLKITMAALIEEAGEECTGQYRDTPLDFISPNEWVGSLVRKYFVDFFADFALNGCFFMLVVSMAYTAFFPGAWDFYFPTVAEQQLWRAVVATQAIIALLGPLPEVFMVDRQVKPNESALPIPSITISSTQRLLRKIRRLWYHPCNNEMTGDFPCVDVPLHSLLILTPACALYVICRWLIIAMDIASLRAQPASTYETISWSMFLPWW
ncbi:hypothetical protein B0A48_00654 [Cryoendolithus antarcticus]|uniref:Uncharacterized protein n=1 Tax=Cryoendolithus antarcticus TaxID=1507870 RepID=A0A1V8TVG7_9PEZI|nr:hypothetical protein B0A48_00654 [Cryoendolithus antarcticus]